MIERVFRARLSGPPDARDATLDALRGAGFTAYDDIALYPDNEEESALAWIAVEPPTDLFDDQTQEADFVQRLETVIGQLGFRLRLHGLAERRYWDLRRTSPLAPLNTVSVSEPASAPFLWSLLNRLANTPVNLLAVQALSEGDQKRVAREFAAYIRQAESYYKAGQSVAGASAALLFYYSIMNLAKAELLLWNPELVLDRRVSHGIRLGDTTKGFSDWTVKIEPKGIFEALYERRLGVPLPDECRVLRVADLFARCGESAFEFQEAGFGEPQVCPCYLAVVTDGTHSWAQVLINRYGVLQQSTPVADLLLDRLRIVPGPYSYDIARRFALSERRGFLQSALLTARVPRAVRTLRMPRSEMIVASLLIEEWVEDLYRHLRPVLDYGTAESDFALTPSLSATELVGMPSNLARYACMFVVSSLVRYQPSAVDDRQFPDQAWYLNAFTGQGALPLLHSALNNISDKPVVFDPVPRR